MSTVAEVVSGVLVGLAALVAALKVLAPRTKTTVDDALLADAEKVEVIVEGVAGYFTPKAPAATPPAPAPAPTPAPVSTKRPGRQAV